MSGGGSTTRFGNDVGQLFNFSLGTGKSTKLNKDKKKIERTKLV
jgi:hypothetical protein